MDSDVNVFLLTFQGSLCTGYCPLQLPFSAPWLSVGENGERLQFEWLHSFVNERHAISIVVAAIVTSIVDFQGTPHAHWALSPQ